MNNRTTNYKIWIVSYFVTFSAFSLLSLLPNTSVPIELNYITLLSIFAIPLIIALKYDPPKGVLSIFLFMTPFVVMLAVIAPNEAGFYGFDPYNHNLPAYFRFREGYDSLILWLGNWPGFPAFVSVFVEILGPDVWTTGKYAPLVATAVPTLLFVGLCRHVERMYAFFVGIGVASGQTLLMFEARFVEEPLGLALLLAIILVIFVTPRGKHRSLMLLPILFTTATVHHYSAGVAVFVLFTWALVPHFPFERIHSHLRPIKTKSIPDSRQSLLLAIAVTTMFAFPYVLIINRIIRRLLTGFNPKNSPTAPSEGGNSLLTIAGATPPQLLLKLSFGIYLLLCIITAVGILSRKPAEDWQVSWAVIAAVFTVSFVVTTAVGRLVPLSAGRFLGVMVPFLLAVSISLIERRNISLPHPRKIVAVIVVVFIVTQLAQIPAYRIDTNPSQMVYPEGHYTASEFQTVDWFVDHGAEQRINDRKHELWRTDSYQNASQRLRENASCTGFLVSREDYLGAEEWGPPTNNTKVFDAGNISLMHC
jgi:hypothetical protein